MSKKTDATIAEVDLNNLRMSPHNKRGEVKPAAVKKGTAKKKKKSKRTPF